MSVFGTSTNPHAATGGGLFSGPMQENHTIPREVFSGNNAQYASARRFLTLLGFDGENAARNANWAPANEADALSLQSAMHRGSHPEYSKFIAANIVLIGERYEEEAEALKISLSQEFPSETPEQIEQRAWRHDSLKSRMDADIDRFIGTIPELMQKFGPDGKPLLVFNDSDPRAPNEATAIMQKLTDEYKFYEDDGNGGFKYGEKFQQLASWNDPSAKGLLNFGSDGRPDWDDSLRAEYLASQSLVNKFRGAGPNGEIDTRAITRRQDTTEYRDQVARLAGLLGDLGDANGRFAANTEAEVERAYLRAFRTASDKMQKFAEYSVGKANQVLSVFTELGDKAPDFVKNGLKKAIDYHRNGNSTFSATRVGTSMAASVLAIANIWVEWERHEAEGGDIETFIAEQANNAIVSIPFAAGIGAAALTPLGPAVLFTATAVGTYAGIRNVVDYLANDYGLDEEGSTYKFLKSIDVALGDFEDRISRTLDVAQRVAGIISADPVGSFETAIETIAARSIEWSGGENAAIPGEDNDILIGDDLALLAGDEQDNWLVHRGAGEVYGGAGGDVLFGWRPEVLKPLEAVDRATRDAEKAGKSSDDYAAMLAQYAIEKAQYEFLLDQYQQSPGNFPEPPVPPEWLSVPRIKQESRLLLDGGEGNDWIIVAGGEGAVINGGAGNDLLINLSQGGIIYGGAGADIMQIGAGTVIADADASDTIIFGLPLFGGVKQWWMEGNIAYWAPFSTVTAAFPVIGSGILTAAATFVDVATMKFASYQTQSDGSLHVNIGYGLGGSARIEDYRLDLDTGLASGSVVVFQSDRGGNASSGNEGNSRDRLIQFVNLALKAGFGFGFNGWDPVVLDLDGDGYELTTQRNSGVHFEFDSDGFAEKTGWVRPDDGFLVLDANGNGIVDDASEFFGDETQGGFVELATHDLNLDGVIDSLDTVFNNLRVWRDLDSDGATDAGELATLSNLGITSISLAATAPAQPIDIGGNVVAFESTFTLANGTVRKAGDVVLDISHIDTRYLGDTLVSAPAAALPQLRGFGNVADLHVAMSEDAALLAQVQAFDAMAEIAVSRALTPKFRRQSYKFRASCTCQRNSNDNETDAWRGAAFCFVQREKAA